jgi:hypothetical protein
MASDDVSTLDAETGPPPYDPAAVGRLVPFIELRAVDLVNSYFARADADLEPKPPPEGNADFGVQVDFALLDDPSLLSVIVGFAVFHDEAPTGAPFELQARFRLIYEVAEDAPAFAQADAAAFAHWNSVFNAWPYWREFLASSLARAGLPPMVAPVMRVPRAGDS